MTSSTASVMQKVMVMSALLKNYCKQECWLIPLTRLVDHTARTYAGEFNRTDVIRLLRDKRPDVNKRDCWGNTPVHFAAMMSSIDAFAVLMEYEASINMTNNDGDRPIDIAHWYEIKAAVRVLEQL